LISTIGPGGEVFPRGSAAVVTGALDASVVAGALDAVAPNVSVRAGVGCEREQADRTMTAVTVKEPVYMHWLTELSLRSH
jgi:hypothetical protein